MGVAPSVVSDRLTGIQQHTTRFNLKLWGFVVLSSKVGKKPVPVPLAVATAFFLTGHVLKNVTKRHNEGIPRPWVLIGRVAWHPARVL